MADNITNIICASHEQVADALAVCAKANITPCLVGASGEGKTTAVRKFAENMGVECITTHFSTRDAADTEGVPFPEIETQTVHWFKPADFPTEGPAVWLLDEFDRTDESVQNSLTRLVLDGVIGEYECPKDIFRVAAMNGVTDVYTTPLSEAMRQRCCFLYMYDDTPGPWMQWATDEGVDERFTSFAGANWDVVGGDKPEFEDYAQDVKNRKRSMARGSALLTAAEDMGLEHVGPLLLQGVLGFPTMMRVMAHFAVFNGLPTVEDIVRAPSTIKVPKSAALCYTLGALVANSIEAGSGTHLRDKVIFLTRLPREVAEFSTRAAGLKNPDVFAVPEYLDWHNLGA